MTPSRRFAAATILVALVGCNATEPLPIETGTTVRDGPAQREAPLLRLPGGGVNARAPVGFLPMPPEQLQRLEASLGAEGRQARVRGMMSPPGAPAGAAYVATISHFDRGALYGESVANILNFTVRGRLEAAGKDTGGRLEFEVARHPTGRALDLVATNNPGTTTVVWIKTRLFATTASTVEEHVCFCTGSGCGEAAMACELPSPPSDAISTEDPLHPGGAPRVLRLPNTRSSLKAPPFYVLPNEAWRPAWTSILRDAAPDAGAISVAGLVSPSNSKHSVGLARLQRCVAEKECDAEGLARDAARSATAVQGVHAETFTNPDESYVEVVLTMKNAWERHVFLARATGVTELVCRCEGPACLVTAPSCKLEP